jgi:hypothetical protein
MSTLVVGEAMPTTKNQVSADRLRLLRQIRQLAQTAIYGSLSETYTLARLGSENPDTLSRMSGLAGCEKPRAWLEQGTLGR